MVSKVIMAVDDSASIRQMVTFTLKEAGYQTIEGCDGVDALKKLKTNHIDMMITDLNMPNMNGIELIKEIRLHPSFRYIPIIMLTTESQVEKKQEGKDAGATGWIVKPFKPDQLISVIKKVLG